MKKLNLLLILIIVFLTFIGSIMARDYSEKSSLNLNALIAYAIASEENSGNGYQAVHFTCEYTDEYGITHSGYYIDCQYTGTSEICTPTGCIMN